MILIGSIIFTVAIMQGVCNQHRDQGRTLCWFWRLACERMGMLRITLHESETTVRMVLEGRVAGPWVGELDRVWNETAPRLGSKKLAIDLSDMTYADPAGRSVLKIIFSQSGAKLVAASLGAEDLAGAIAAGCSPN